MEVKEQENISSAETAFLSDSKLLEDIRRSICKFDVHFEWWCNYIIQFRSPLFGLTDNASLNNYM